MQNRPVCAVKDSYAAEKTDEFVEPTAIVKDGQPVGTYCRIKIL